MTVQNWNYLGANTCRGILRRLNAEAFIARIKEYNSLGRFIYDRIFDYTAKKVVSRRELSIFPRRATISHTESRELNGKGNYMPDCV